MSNLEKKVAALMRLCTAEDNESYEAAKKEVRGLMDAADKRAVAADLETETRRTLTELGVPDHLVGHPYLIRAIMIVADDYRRIGAMTKPGGLYHALAEEFGETASRVERAIRHCIEVAWTRCDYEVLNDYFGNIVNPEKGKTTNSEFIARVASVIRMRMRQ